MVLNQIWFEKTSTPIDVKSKQSKKQFDDVF